jgi:hypothetical protein
LPFPDRALDALIAVRLLVHVVDFPTVFSVDFWQPLLFGIKRRIEGNTRPFFCYDVRQLSRPYGPRALVGFESRSSSHCR